MLGAVEARRDGDRLSVPTGRTTELLVRLALEAGSGVRVDALLDDLWPTHAGRNTLQSKVSQLRRALGDKDVVVAEGDRYRLAVEPHAVDAVRVLDLAARAATATRAGDASTALATASEGLALFRGEILVDAGDWAAPHRGRLEEVRLTLLEDAMAARVDLGSGGELVSDLEALVAQHPLRERLWGSLMTALYRGGRQADALAAYARVRRLLVAELGIEPGPDLRRLEQQLLQQSAVLGGSTAPAPATAPGNLPPTRALLVGRDRACDDLRALVDAHRLVTVVGPAGVGKTRLLLEVARQVRAPGGVWLVRLEAVDASADLEQVIAETLHVSGGGQLRERLQGAQTVILLDNCEHVIAQVSALVSPLLDDLPGLRICATSQVAMGVVDEVVHHLEPLSTEDSVTLFWARAREMRHTLVIDAEATAQVEEVCRSLDGLPLAIELAAARVRSLSIGDIARRLDDRFALLQDPSSNQSERRRALAGAIAWSYDLLFPDDQRGLWALSCFAGSASLAAVEHVLDALGVPPEAVVDTLTRLVDRSLVTVDGTEDGGVRYRLLDSIRAYAGDRLADAGLTATGHRAHALWYAATAQWCADHIRGTDQPTCLAIARAERANVDAALAWCRTNEPDLGSTIATGFGWTWVVLGDGPAAAARIRGALTTTAPDERSAALLVAGWLEASAGNVALAGADIDAAAEIADHLGSEVLHADVARHRAFLALQQGSPQEALDQAVAGLLTYRRLTCPWETAASLLLAAYGELMLGDTAAAARDGVEAVDILTPLGDSWGLVHAMAMLGGIAQVEHRFADAIDALSGAVRESTVLGFPGQAALHRGSLARVQQRAGDVAGATASFELALGAATASGDGRMAATARLSLARLLRTSGDGAAAVPWLRENLDWYAGAGGGDGALLTRCLLAIETGDRAALDVVLALARADETPLVTVLALDGRARLSAEDGDHVRARELVAEADALHPVVAHLLDDADRPDRAAVEARAAAHPG
ncbi:AfsR/SARP family transcriptional regulator [Nocardioides alpinus]|uniref:AfsR/SARP family transcriptional regulator n=1 Tax=Nocardioides alpinus TaxID=748909 RepID=A0ABX4QXB5_9ACTN|nr:AfsR/SARP family transcriptional regulator [Nocardioides alpinus]